MLIQKPILSKISGSHCTGWCSQTWPRPFSVTPIYLTLSQTFSPVLVVFAAAWPQAALFLALTCACGPQPLNFSVLFLSSLASIYALERTRNSPFYQTSPHFCLLYSKLFPFPSCGEETVETEDWKWCQEVTSATGRDKIEPDHQTDVCLICS